MGVINEVHRATQEKLKRLKEAQEVFHTCTTCFARYETKKDHTCWHAKCSGCGEMMDLTEHQCYIQPEDEEEDGLEPTLFVYADIEAMTIYNMADDIYFSGDEEWERAMVQAVDHSLLPLPRTGHA